MKLFRSLLRGLLLTSVLFLVTACNSTPQPSMFDEGGEAPMSFSLVSNATGEPLEGIVISGKRVEAYDGYTLGITGADGKCKVAVPYMRNFEGPFLHFEDPDGNFIAKDTSLTDLREREILVKLNPKQ